jgi:hypothetical protein
MGSPSQHWRVIAGVIIYIFDCQEATSLFKVWFRTFGNVLLCKTTHALPLALSGTNEYH